MGESFKLKTFENVSYNALGKIIQLLFQGAANIILARNLASSDYGVAGFAMIVIGFIAQFGDLGVHTAALQTGELDNRGLYTAFTIKTVLGLGICAIALLLAPLAGVLFDSEAVVKAVRLLSVNFVLNSFAFLPSVTLARELNYKTLFTPQLVSVVVNSVIAILMARRGFGYWSIIAANVASTAVFALLLNVCNPVKLKFMFYRPKAEELLSFGGNIFFTGLLAFLIFNADNFIIGVVRGAGALGYYALAFNWGSLICGLIGTVVLSVLLPTFSKFQGDPGRLRKAYLRVMAYVCFFGVFANAGLFSVAREFLFVVLGRGGEKWLPALNSLRILCVYGVLRLIMEPGGHVILAVGKSAPIFRAQILVASLELILIYPALRYFGIEGVACAVTAAYLVEYVALYPILCRELQIKVLECLSPAFPAVLSGVFAVAAVAVAGNFPLSVAGLAGKLSAFSIVYLMVYGFLTKWELAGEMLEVLKEFCLKPSGAAGAGVRAKP